MGNYDVSRRGVPEWMTTLGAMKKHGTVVIRTCTSPCRFVAQVNLDEMIRLLGGEDMTLWDTRPPCEAIACEKLNHYMASPGRGTPMRPLLSSFGYRDPEQLPPQAWMAGWLGRRG